MLNDRKPSFNFISPVYDRLARLVFGKTLLYSQVFFIHKIPQESKILIIGGGTGRLLQEILNRKNGHSILYLEASEKMLAQSKNLVRQHPDIRKVEFRLGDEDSILPTEKFDVIISNFFLDLFAPPIFDQITGILYKALKPGGFWFVTDFVSPSGNIFFQVAGRILLKLMYIFFRIVSGISAQELPDWHKRLKEIHLKPADSFYFYHRLIKTVYYIK